MLSMTEIRKGKIINLEGQPYQVTSANYLRMQQRRPVMKTILKHVQTGATREHTFQQSDKVEEADIGRTPYQYLYQDDGTYTFMDDATYDQIELSAEMLGDSARYLIEGQTIDIVMFAGEPIGVELPIKIERKVIEAPEGVRGDTSSNVTKDILVEGNLRVKAPLFIKEGEVIRIDTRTGDYVERA
ncbi:MAG: elongation factor P [Candidatus Andersenbacteria bacterium]|nr:elongation factor P [Candidatus Andersenbacteria bacterium]MBI3251152.1 elongation factor P [Candidatus Andersenbacteria bacterium]